MSLLPGLIAWVFFISIVHTSVGASSEPLRAALQRSLYPLTADLCSQRRKTLYFKGFPPFHGLSFLASMWTVDSVFDRRRSA